VALKTNSKIPQSFPYLSRFTTFRKTLNIRKDRGLRQYDIVGHGAIISLSLKNSGEQKKIPEWKWGRSVNGPPPFSVPITENVGDDCSHVVSASSPARVLSQQTTLGEGSCGAPTSSVAPRSVGLSFLDLLRMRQTKQRLKKRFRLTGDLIACVPRRMTLLRSIQAALPMRFLARLLSYFSALRGAHHFLQIGPYRAMRRRAARNPRSPFFRYDCDQVGEVLTPTVGRSVILIWPSRRASCSVV
jgi:hypothetical protein